MLKTGSKIYQNKSLDTLRKLLVPHTKRAYLVGGCVRDALLGRDIYDYDVEVYDVPPAKFDSLMQSIGASGVGRSYFIYKFHEFDLGLPRIENKVGLRHTDFEVSYCNDETQACLRRDFSVNALMINLFSGELFDFVDGLNDLKNRTLRHLDDEKFCEDSLRVLRGVQFAARLNFSIAPKTLELMKTLDLNNLSHDRIICELVKFFRSTRLDIGARYLYELGLFEKFFELKITSNELENFCFELKNAREFISDERLFLYLLCGYFDLDVLKICENLKLPKFYASIAKEPFFKGQVSTKELMQISLLKPLKDWLGSYNNERINVAKKLKIFTQKFNPDINMNEILTLGLKGNAIGAELRRQQNERIDEYLAQFDAKI